MNECETYRNDGVFVTLTYNEDEVPRICPACPGVILDNKVSHDYGLKTLYKKDVQDFMKRLRNKVRRRLGIKYQIRYDMVGEYGGKYGRPHYHLIIFGWFPKDARVIKNKGRYNEYMSDFITECWNKGRCTIGKVNNYVATYITKYIEKDAKFDYGRYVLPEFELGSKSKGGLGYRWFEKNYKQVISQGFIFVFDRNHGTGYKMRIPRYYIECLARIDPDAYEKYKKQCRDYMKEKSKESNFDETDLEEALHIEK